MDEIFFLRRELGENSEEEDRNPRKEREEEGPGETNSFIIQKVEQKLKRTCPPTQAKCIASVRLKE